MLGLSNTLRPWDFPSFCYSWLLMFKYYILWYAFIQASDSKVGGQYTGMIIKNGSHTNTSIKSKTNRNEVVCNYFVCGWVNWVKTDHDIVFSCLNILKNIVLSDKWNIKIWKMLKIFTTFFVLWLMQSCIALYVLFCSNWKKTQTSDWIYMTGSFYFFFYNFAAIIRSFILKVKVCWFISWILHLLRTLQMTIRNVNVNEKYSRQNNTMNYIIIRT